MILLVPISPEVPRKQRPDLWPSILMVLFVAACFLKIYPALKQDSEYIQVIQEKLEKSSDTREAIEKQASRYLEKRPLLELSPARGNWDLRRLLFANFIHGSIPHLLLNLLGLFAGVRILSTFVPFLCTLSIYLLGGSIGLYASMMLTVQFSDFIPHVGASAGIFALMGAYYVYNFHFRTSYFFWFPSHRGVISMRTYWFFFVDVILLELVLSTAQFFPDRIDAVDHIAHVVGFSSGMCIAFTLRFIQRWPSYLQTRSEFLFWRREGRKWVKTDRIMGKFRTLCHLIRINRYNDKLKIELLKLVAKTPGKYSDKDLKEVFKSIRPTYIRLHTEEVAHLLKRLFHHQREVPASWFSHLPYDSVIRIAKAMTDPINEQMYLLEFLSRYKKHHREGHDVHQKLELLMEKLHITLSTPKEKTQKVS